MQVRFRILCVNGREFNPTSRDGIYLSGYFVHSIPLLSCLPNRASSRFLFSSSMHATCARHNWHIVRTPSAFRVYSRPSLSFVGKRGVFFPCTVNGPFSSPTNGLHSLSLRRESSLVVGGRVLVTHVHVHGRTWSVICAFRSDPKAEEQREEGARKLGRAVDGNARAEKRVRRQTGGETQAKVREEKPCASHET